MKFHKLGLTTAAAVLASIVSAGAYTQPAPHIATPVGSGVDGFSLYIGGGLSQLGGSVENSQSVKSFTTLLVGNGTGTAASTTNGSNAAITQSEVLTVSGLKFGGEGHLGAYFGVAEGFGVGVEAFGVTRTSFNPISSTTVLSNDTPGSTTVLTSANANAGATANTNNPTADAYTLGVNIKPNSLGYGVRMMPTVMISDQFGMYVSVGYGSQKFQGTLTNSAFAYLGNLYNTGLNAQIGTAVLTNGTLNKSLSGINYGMGSFFNVDETISIFSGLEVQKFNTYDVSSLNTGAKTSASTPTTLNAVSGTTTIAQASTTVPSTLKVQLNTYSVGIDYAFV